MGILYQNNAHTTLAGDITSGATTVTVVDGSGFPTPTGSDTFWATIEAADGLTREIVSCTARAGNSISITRAQQSTSAAAWPAGSTFDMRWTAEDARRSKLVFEVASAANLLPYSDGVGSWTGTAFTAFARTLLDDTTAIAALTTLDAGIASLAGIDTAADLIGYTTAANTWASAPITAAGRSMIGAADAAAQLALLPSWKSVQLASVFQTTSATSVAVTGLKFTPSANKTYVVMGFLMLRSTNINLGVRPGINWPTGLDDNMALMEAAQGQATTTPRAWGPTTDGQFVTLLGMGSTTESWPAHFHAIFRTGASPSGDFQITLASETGGSQVEMRQYSSIMYMELP